MWHKAINWILRAWPYLSLSGDLALLVGSFFGLLAVSIIWWKQVKSTKFGLFVSSKMWTNSRVIKVVTEEPFIEKYGVRTFIFVIGFILGFGAQGVQQFIRTDGYTMHVVSRTADDHSWRVTVQGGKPFVFTQCHDEPSVGFEKGETVGVVFGESSDRQGQCNRFYDNVHHGFQSERDKQGNLILTEAGQ